jgi:hypothetical protein
LQMWSAAMRNLIDVGAITVDEQTEAWVRQQMDMPKLQTPWVPYEERPSGVTERITKILQNMQAGGGNGNTPSTQDFIGQQPTSSDKSSNGGGGNIGKSPSSSAV